MKYLISLGLCLSLSATTFAQDVHEGMVRYKSEDHTGMMASYDAPKDVTEGALLKRIGAAGLGRQRHEGDYWKYEGVTWTEISPNKINIYFNVERHDGKSMVYMLASASDGNFITSTINPAAAEAMKGFLTRFKDDLTAYQQALAVAAQQRVVADAEGDKRRTGRDADRMTGRQKKADRKKAQAAAKALEEQQRLDAMQQEKR